LDEAGKFGLETHLT
jgi:hypothetical protein